MHRAPTIVLPMARKRRNQSPDCLHHVMGRGCRGQPIFGESVDREHFAYLLSEVAERFEWTIYGWVFMPNHHHLLLGLKEPNLGKGMHRAHFMFGQRWNERNESTGHALFRRYKSVPLLRENAPQRVLRYIDLNPVRAGLCARPEDWEWSGFSANIGRRNALGFHSPDAGLRVMVPHTSDPVEARPLYAQSVYDRLDATRGRGSAHDVRPTLEEILIPGDVDSLREATDTWWYSQRALARHIGCSHTTIQAWFRGVPSGRDRAALDAWRTGTSRR